MSIFPWGLPLQLLEKAAAALGQDCVLCGAGPSEALVCGACAADLPRAGDADAVFAYAFPVDRLVLRFKFAADLAVGRWLAERLAAHVRCQPRPDLLVAPPLTPARLRQRGFNQALEIAKVAGAELRVPVDLDALVRMREGEPQSRLGLRRRRANLRGAFAGTRRFDGAHVAIIDDVVTTGATMAAVSQALRAAGAARVSGWAVARTPAPGR